MTHDHPITNDYERLLGLALTNKDAARFILDHPIIQDNINRHLVEAIKHQLSLTGESAYELRRDTFKDILDIWKIAPQDIAANMGVYNRCLGAAAKASELEALKSKLSLFFASEEAIEHVKANDHFKAADAFAAVGNFERANEQMKLAAKSGATTKASEVLSLAFGSDDFPKPIVRIASFIAAECKQPLCIAHYFAALWTVGSVIGKRAVLKNGGQTYYPSLWIAILARSGWNKSGLITSANNLAKAVTRSWEQTASTVEYFLETIGDIIPPKATDKDAARTDIERKHRDRRDAFNFVTDEFRVFIRSMVPESEAIGNGQFLCKLTDNGELSKGTVGSGYRVSFETCVNFLGASQADPWNDEMRTVAFQSGGLAARILPINVQVLDVRIDSIPTSWTEAIDILEGIKAFVSHNDAIEAFEVDESIAKCKAFIRTRENIETFIQESQSEWDVMESIVLIQAAKVAIIHAIANEWQRATDAHDDCGDFRRIRLTVESMENMWWLIAHAHVYNANMTVSMSEQGQKQEKVLKQLRKRGTLTKAQLTRFTNMASWEVGNILDMLRSDEIAACEKGKSGKGERWYLLKEAKRKAS